MCEAFYFLPVNGEVKREIPFVRSLRSQLVHVLFQYSLTSSTSLRLPVACPFWQA